jgi:hypothetical protein
MNVLPFNNVPTVLDFLKKGCSNINSSVSITDAKTTGTGTHGIRRVKF